MGQKVGRPHYEALLRQKESGGASIDRAADLCVYLCRDKRKSDRIDAHKLARLGRVDPQSFYPIQHGSREMRQDLVVPRARDAVVAARTELINATWGLVKSMGTRLPKCSSPSLGQKVKDAIPEKVREALLPLVQLADALSD
jgi:hypothetical protein